MNHNIKQKNTERGITLLITLLTMGVLLSVASSLMFITLKQFQLSGIVNSSEVAFQAATAGLECGLFYDLVQDEFDVGEARNNSVDCFGVNSNDNGDDGGTLGVVDSGEEQVYRYSWGSPAVCTEISIYKFYDPASSVHVNVPGVIRDINKDGNPDSCPAGSECTVLQARGYNVDCALILSSTRVVEREYIQVY